MEVKNISTEIDLVTVLNTITETSINKSRFSSRQINKLKTYIKTEQQLKIFIDYYNIFKDWYVPNLIITTYVRYFGESGTTISRIVNLSDKCEKEGITGTSNKRLHSGALYILQDVIKTETDWQEFKQMWNENKHKKELGTIILFYEASKKAN